MKRIRVIWPLGSIGVLAFLLLFLNTATSRAEAALPPPPTNCRFGAAVAGSSMAIQAPWLERVNAEWYLDFGAHTPSLLTNAEFVQVVALRQKKVDCNYLAGYDIWPGLTETGLGAVIASHRGALWIIGNEPDRGPNPGKCWPRGQSDTMPEVYAQGYHDAYVFIKAHDPTARVANAGLVEATPGRLQYLDKVWQAYLDQYGTPMPVDVWSFHLYVLPEAYPDGQPNGIANVALSTDPALAIRESGGDPAKCSDPKVYCYAEHDDMVAFSEQVVAMRTWMKQHGQQNKPLILSEYSILYPYQIDLGPPPTCWVQDEYGQCFTSDRVRRFMTESFNYLDSATDPNLGYPADGNRLVQRWLWFGMYFQMAGYVSNLLTDSQTALTPVGELFQSSVASRSTYVNLRADPIPPLSTHASSGGVTISISVNVYNVGTTLTADPFTVTFYSDSALTRPIGSVVIEPGLVGCEGQRTTATVSWPNLSPGSHQFWAWVDSGGSIDESNEGDNVVSGSVAVYSYGVRLPLISRH